MGDESLEGLALRFNGLEAPSTQMNGTFEEVAMCRPEGPGEERESVGICSSSDDILGLSSMFGRASASSETTSISAPFPGVFLGFLRVLLGVRALGFLSVSSPLSMTRHISTGTGAFSRMSIQILARYQYRVNSATDMHTRWFS